MNVIKIVSQLNKKYPNKKIIKNDAINPTEILCEVEPGLDHPEYSLAIAVIDKSKPHYHKHLTEEYRVIKGKLTLHIEGKTVILKPGNRYKILPNQTHWAEGNETWIECHSIPGWTVEDHILVN